MKTFGVILLIYSITVHLISKLSPTPFIGFAVILLSFPLALKLSIKELLIINVISTFFGVIIQLDTLIQYYVFATIMVTYHPLISAIIYVTGVMIGVCVGTVFLSFIMKTFSRFTPKRIKVLLNEP